MQYLIYLGELGLVLGADFFLGNIALFPLRAQGCFLHTDKTPHTLVYIQ